MPKRIFKTVGGKLVEVTPDGDRATCDQIEKAVKPFHEPLEFQLPKNDKRRRKVALWPRELDACGVNPDQVQAAEAEAAKRGVPTEYNKTTGNPIFRDQNHEKKFCKSFGYYNLNAGYGDAAPDHYVQSTHSESVAKQKRREYHDDIKRQIREIEASLFGNN
jgi:hypothetical protein